MASNTVSTLDAALKQYYAGGKLTKMAYMNHPTLALLPKSKKFPGRNIPIVPWFAGTAGQSHTFANAQANKSVEQVVAFLLTRKKDYALADIDLEALYASEDDAGAFLKLGTDAVENTNLQVSRNISTMIFQNFGSARGKVSSISGTDLTLTKASDVVYFEKGMVIKQSTTDGTSGSIGAAAGVTITGINRRTGVLTAAAWTGFSANDFLFRDGDFGLGMNGFADWIPSSVTATAFLGVDRTADTRLAGTYINAATLGLGMVEAIEEADAQLAREGGMPTHLVLNPLDLRLLKTQLGDRIEYDFAKSPDQLDIGFKTLAYPSVSGAGLIKIYADADCPKDLGYMLTMSSWELKTLGDAPRGLEGNGFKFITKASEDAVEVRVGMYGNLACFAPNQNAAIQFA